MTGYKTVQVKKSIKITWALNLKLTAITQLIDG